MNRINEHAGKPFPRMAGKPFSQDDDDRIAALLSVGATADEIARKLRRTAGGIEARMSILKLTPPVRIFSVKKVRMSDAGGTLYAPVDQFGRQWELGVPSYDAERIRRRCEHLNELRQLAGRTQ